MTFAQNPQNPRQFLEHIINQTILEIQPEFILRNTLPAKSNTGRTIVITLGKMALQMARIVSNLWEPPFTGIALGAKNYDLLEDNTIPTKEIPNFKVFEATHPFSDMEGVIASTYILETVQNLTKDDHVLVLLSGGASALLAGLPENGSLATMNSIVKDMMDNGGDIFQFNLFRRAYSNIRGGRLAQACAPASVLTLAISDVPGDNPIYIGSGPTVPDACNVDMLYTMLHRLNITPPDELKQAILSMPATINNPNTIEIILKPIDALHKICTLAQAQWHDNQLRIINLGDMVTGNALAIAEILISVARSCLKHATPMAPPCLIVSGGEATPPPGKIFGQGGPNSSFALAASALIHPDEPIYAIAVDSDGKDGSAGMGGYADAQIATALSKRYQLNIQEELSKNDSFNVLSLVEAAIDERVTNTNVNDLRAILVLAP